jgi:uncharacterized membrane protein YdcZ (DUF606 family)
VNMKLLSIFLMLLAGFCLSIQGPVNARLCLALESSVFAALSAFLVGLSFFCVTWSRLAGHRRPLGSAKIELALVIFRAAASLRLC